MKKTIIIGVIFVTLCIIYLTWLAGDALKSSIQAQDVRNELIMSSTNVDSLCCFNNHNQVLYQKDSALLGKDTSKIVTQPVISEKDSTIANKRSTELTTDSSKFLDSIVYNLTLAVNAVNNVLTSGSIFIAILTLFIGLVGLFGFYSLKSDLKDKINEFDTKVTKNETTINSINELINKCCNETKDKINEVDGKFNTFEQRIKADIQADLEEISRKNDNLTKRIDLFHISLTQQERYIEQTINYLFQATNANINQMSDQDQAREILRRIYHEMQIARLYRTSLNAENNETYNRERFAVLAYLEMNGTREDIPHLEYVVQHDTNEDNRRRAIEVIGIIRSRG